MSRDRTNCFQAGSRLPMKCCFVGCQLVLVAVLGFLSFIPAFADGVHGRRHPLKESASVWWSEKHENGQLWIKVKTLIQAPAQTVWQAIHQQCSHDPDVISRKVISRGANDLTLEEKLGWLPIIGPATCTLYSTEIPLQRMDYRMLSSDRLKALEGSWVLTPGPRTDSTYLELSSYCDIGIPVPRFLREGITVRKLETRLSIVKKVAESSQKQISETLLESR